MATMFEDLDFSRELIPIKILLIQSTAKLYIENFVDEDVDGAVSWLIPFKKINVLLNITGDRTG